MDGSGGQKFNVGGVLLDRPFKIRRLGHFGFNVCNFDACLKFYSELLGFALSDPLDFSPRVADDEERGRFDATVGWFMRHGGDHHSFVLFPKPILDHIGGRSTRPDITVNQITWQVGSLREVAEAESWLRGHDVRIRRSGRDQPGSNWHVYPFDPDEHINELYYGIEQIGWDGRSKPPRCTRRSSASSPACRRSRNTPRSTERGTRAPISAPATATRPGSKRATTWAACCCRGPSRSCGSARCGCSPTTSTRRSASTATGSA